MTNSSLLTTLALSTFAIASSAAHASPAASVSSASLTNFSYQLVDLNTFDNLAPSITFNLYSTGNVSSLIDTSAQQNRYATATLLNTDALINTSRTLSTTNTAASGSTTAGTGAYGLINSSAYASGSAIGASSALDGSNSYQSKSFITSFLSSYTVSAFTGVVFYANANVQASASNLPAHADPATNFASASASLELSGPGQTAFNGKMAYADSATGNGADSGRIAVSYFNFTNLSQEGHLRAYASTEGSVSVAAVPEPESYAMLLAGLGLMAGIARRRNQAK